MKKILALLLAGALAFGVAVAEGPPAEDWVRQINAAAGPFEDMADTPQSAIAERHIRAFMAQKWGDAELVALTVVFSPQAPETVIGALDELLTDYPKRALRIEGQNVLAIVMDPEEPEYHAYLVMIIHLKESNSTALHIAEMRRVAKEKQG